MGQAWHMVMSSCASLLVMMVQTVVQADSAQMGVRLEDEMSACYVLATTEDRKFTSFLILTI